MSNDSSAVVSSIGTNEGFSVSMGGTEGTEMNSSDGSHVEFEPGAVQSEPEEQKPDDASPEDNLKEEIASEGEDEGSDDDEGGDDEPLEDLGDFDPEDTTAWDERYYPDGEMDQAVLSKEFFQNQANGEAGLNEGTYEYLASKGISKGFAKEVEAALMTQHEANSKNTADADGALFEVAGGADNLKAALDWGKGGGYSKEAQKAFNTATSSKDPQKRQEAVELLMYRYQKANPEAGKSPKPSLPKRDATKGTNTRPPKVRPFASRQEYREAKKKAGDDQRQLELVAKRLYVSEF